MHKRQAVAIAYNMGSLVNQTTFFGVALIDYKPLSVIDKRYSSGLVYETS